MYRRAASHLVGRGSFVPILLLACAPLVGCGTEEDDASLELGTQSSDLHARPRDATERELGQIALDLHALDRQAKSIANARRYPAFIR